MNICSSLKISIWVLFITVSAVMSGYPQTFTVKGRVTASDMPVKYASVTFIDQNDTSRRFFALTDSSGNYRVDVVTSVKPPPSQPTTFELGQNYPNPFLSTTTIPYEIKEQSNITISIYNVLGQIVRELKSGAQSAGVYGIEWDGTNRFGKRVSPGVYLYHTSNGGRSQCRKMLVGIDGGAKVYQPPLVSGQGDRFWKVGGELSSQGHPIRVRIDNGANTKPKILLREMSGIAIGRDTTINLEVDLGIMAYSYCYARWDSQTVDGRFYQDWDLYLNGPQGMSPMNITRWEYDDYDPAWSPNGRYIAYWRFQHRQSSGIANLCLYDTYNDTCVVLLPSDTASSGSPILWTPDSKNIVYQFHAYRPNGIETHMVKVDGTGDRLLAHRPEWFYSDSYTFIYSDDSGRVYKTNLDNSINELASGLWSDVGGVIPQWFDPRTEEVFFTRNSDSQRTIEGYDLVTGKLRVVMAGDTGYSVAGVSLSGDLSSSVFNETNNGKTFESHREFLSVLEKGIKRRLVSISGDEAPGYYTIFSYYAPKFSPDGKFILYGKMFLKLGPWIQKRVDLYVVQISTGATTFIDSVCGHFDWNPLKPH